MRRADGERRLGAGVPDPRPLAAALAAGILVLGGLAGFDLLVSGAYVVTGSLPAKDPIVGVALILYGASIGLGFLVWFRRAWLGAINLTAAFAVLYLVAFPDPVAFVLGLAHGLAAAALWSTRRWFGISIAVIGAGLGDEGH